METGSVDVFWDRFDPDSQLFSIQRVSCGDFVCRNVHEYAKQCACDNGMEFV